MRVLLDFQGFKRIVHWNVQYRGQHIHFQVYNNLYADFLYDVDPVHTTASEPAKTILEFEYHGDHLDPNTQELIPLYKFVGFRQ